MWSEQVGAITHAVQGPPQSTPVSPWFCTRSPQVALMQELLQVSVLTVLPSSHCSPVSTAPLPHDGPAPHARLESPYTSNSYNELPYGVAREREYMRT